MLFPESPDFLNLPWVPTRPNPGQVISTARTCNMLLICLDVAKVRHDDGTPWVFARSILPFSVIYDLVSPVNLRSHLEHPKVYTSPMLGGARGRRLSVGASLIRMFPYPVALASAKRAATLRVGRLAGLRVTHVTERIGDDEPGLLLVFHSEMTLFYFHEGLPHAS